MKFKFIENTWPCHRAGEGYGAIVIDNDDETLVCYAPDRQQVDAILFALNGAASVARCDFLGDWSASLIGADGRENGRNDRTHMAVRSCHNMLDVFNGKEPRQS